MTQVFTPFPFVQVEGTPFEAGHQHGELLGDRVAVSIDHYRARFEDWLRTGWNAVLDLTDQIRAPIMGFAPDLMAEMEGIAAGSENPVSAILALNARTSLMRMTADSVGRSIVECTTGAILPARTADGHTMLFGNWDQHLRCMDNSAVVEVRVTGRPPVLMLTEAGALIRTGFNAAGLGITGNSLSCDRDGEGFDGIPWPVVRRRVLHHERLDHAVEAVRSAPRSHSGNHVIADAAGSAVDLEATPVEVFAIAPEDGILVHSNHFLSPDAAAHVVDEMVSRSPSTCDRLGRVDSGVRSKRGGVDLETIEAALSDHSGFPDSVCAHPGPGRPNAQTIASHVSDLTTRTLRISSGPPCANPYHEYQLA